MAEGSQLAVPMEELNNNLMLVSSALVDLTAKLNEIQETLNTGNEPITHPANGYVNWNSTHDILKTEKWIKMSAFLEYCQKTAKKICTDLGDIDENDKYVINEKTRFPQDELYVNLNNPLVRVKVLYIKMYQACEVDRILNIAKGEAHTFSSFEKEHGLKWVEPTSEVTIAVPECIQKPTSINKTLDETFEPATLELWTSEEIDEPEEDLRTLKLCNNIKNILDKLTQDNFTSSWKKIEEKILEVNDQKRLELLAELLYEKVLEKPGSSEVFAKLTRKLAKIKVPSDDDPDKVASFRGSIINICQKHFEEIMEKRNANDLIVKEVENNIHDKDMVNRIQQALANSKFIGELYKVGILTEKIIDYCLQKLSDGTDDDQLECFCELLATVGEELDDSGMLDCKYIQRLHQILNCKDKKVSDRVLFIIQDVIDLAKKRWVVSAPVLVKNLPKTIDEIKSETHKRALLTQLMNDLGMSGIEQKEQTKVGSDGDRHSKLAGMNLYSVETLKLEASSQKTLNYIQDPPECFIELGADILYKLQANPNSRENMMLTSEVASDWSDTMRFQLNSLETESEKKTNLKKNLRALIKKFLVNEDHEIFMLEVEQLMPMPEDRVAIVTEIVEFVLEKSIKYIRIAAASLHNLLSMSTITPNDFLAGLKAILDFAPDLLIDIPHLYRYLGIIIAPVIVGGHITFEQIHEVSESVISNDQGKFLLFSLIENMYESIGYYFTRELWLKSEMRANQWMTEEISRDCPEIILNVIRDETRQVTDGADN